MNTLLSFFRSKKAATSTGAEKRKRSDEEECDAALASSITANQAKFAKETEIIRSAEATILEASENALRSSLIELPSWFESIESSIAFHARDEPLPYYHQLYRSVKPHSPLAIALDEYLVDVEACLEAGTDSSRAKALIICMYLIYNLRFQSYEIPPQLFDTLAYSLSFVDTLNVPMNECFTADPDVLMTKTMNESHDYVCGPRAVPLCIAGIARYLETYCKLRHEVHGGNVMFESWDDRTLDSRLHFGRFRYLWQKQEGDITEISAFVERTSPTLSVLLSVATGTPIKSEICFDSYRFEMAARALRGSNQLCEMLMLAKKRCSLEHAYWVAILGTPVQRAAIYEPLLERLEDSHVKILQTLLSDVPAGSPSERAFALMAKVKQNLNIDTSLLPFFIEVSPTHAKQDLRTLVAERNGSLSDKPVPSAITQPETNKVMASAPMPSFSVAKKIYQCDSAPQGVTQSPTVGQTVTPPVAVSSPPVTFTPVAPQEAVAPQEVVAPQATVAPQAAVAPQGVIGLLSGKVDS